MSKKIYSPISVLCLIIFMGLCFFACSTPAVLNVHKKAIIMLPGLEGSAMFDADTDELCWALTPDVFLKVEDESYFKGKSSYIEAFFDTDRLGNPKWKMRMGNMSDAENIRYSLMDVFKPAYNCLVNAYGNAYDVLIWQYDWRDSNERNAERFKNFVEQNGYNELVLIAHSMGGHVVNCFLREQENRDKVKLYVPIAVPFYGAAYVYDTICVEFDDELYQPKDVIPSIFGPQNWQSGARRIVAPYQLLPSDELNNWDIYKDNSAFPSAFSLDKTALTMAETFDVWAECFNWFSDENLSLANEVKITTEYYKNMYVEVDGVKKHVAETVPCEIIYGTDFPTRYAASFNGVRIDALGATDYGDNVVTVFSATLGKVSDGTEPTAEGLWRTVGVKHMSIPASNQGLDAINAIMQKHLG